MTDLVVTNFNRNFTGVSATAAGVLRAQAPRYDLVLAGRPLPGCPAPVSRAEARRLSRNAPPGKPFVIWHVRRNTEMRAALWARDVLRLPIRIVFTSAAQRRHSALPRWLISRMDAVIATTERAGSFVPNLRAVVPHGVDCAAFVPATDRAQAWAATGHPGARGIATIGRIRPEKGTDRFIEAMLQLLPERPDLTALVLGRASQGDAAFLQGLKDRVAAAGLTRQILFPGEIAPEALPALVRSLSAVVQLPRYEGYGMAPLEGMASGVPFVATDAGYYREFSQDGTCGIIAQTAGEAAAALAALLGDPARHGAMARAARQAATTRFSVEAEADGIGAVYDALWSGG
ncbi:lipopolysaccharide biosynthesis protein [Pelagivirga sediminicola]|uniref:Lipopolysaccharide biosynthesis protein n=1 Tax=Pelagivirga sediminicola TaxID=2170575 RepID=A0A2T7GCI9_9RHOB|nr:glycosyltransferase family 4 protein [Pelagivirga sediminicola]PVA12098.1 lipopolysaccharide biosynthesis protein [Pelagivirga sediminicola]